MKLVSNAIVALSATVLLSQVSFAQNVTGAGASFPAPIYAKWAEMYNQETGVRINYQSMGSSAGVNQIKAATVDFGASDAPLSDAQLKEFGLVQFPTVIGGVVPVVNIKGIKAGELKLTGEVLADIYLGKITKWNDDKIKAINKDLNLPKAKISVVQRADGSGSSFVFTTYLSKVSSEWQDKVGAGTAVKWPTGTGGKGNEGVSAFVGRLANSIGYVEYAYTKQNNMSYVALENASGQFVEPSEEAFKASAAGIDWRTSFAQDMTYVPGAKAWPLSTATYIIFRAEAEKPEQTAAALKFFDWAYTKGDQAASDLDYVAFPQEVKEIVRDSWKNIVNVKTNTPVSYK